MRTLRMRLVVLAVGLGMFALIAARDADRVEAIGDYCETNECLAQSYGYNMTASFTTGGYPVVATWNYISNTYFQAWPVNGKQSEVHWIDHRVWSSAWWPDGTWSVAQTTIYEGTNAWILGCTYSTCWLAYLGLGSDYSSGDFDYRNLVYWNVGQYPWGDHGKSRATAGLYPTGGASSAINNTRSSCKNLTSTGATDC
jgi:hypothetical protein